MVKYAYGDVDHDGAGLKIGRLSKYLWKTRAAKRSCISYQIWWSMAKKSKRNGRCFYWTNEAAG